MHMCYNLICKAIATKRKGIFMPPEKKSVPRKIIAQNKKAWHDYFVEENMRPASLFTAPR